jgi:ABC-2 type transport system permease protein
MSGGISGREAIRLVARREITERVREKSFLASTGITVVIVVLVAVVPSLLGLGGTSTYTVAVADPAAAPVARAAERAAPTFDAKVKVERVAPAQADAALRDGDVDVVLTRGGIRAEEDPDDELVETLQAANRQVQTAAALQRAGLSPQQQRAALSPPPLRVTTLEATDPDRDAKSGFAFIAVLVLFGQILTYGIWVATGVVEEKSSRVVEVLLATVKPSQLLAGKVIGLGVLGFCQILLVAGLGMVAASAAGALDVDGDVIAAAVLALAWFVLGYAFYAAAYACAGALVPRQEELQSATTPLNTLILISYFVAFAVLQNPDGTLAKVTSFIPITAPVTMPPRIALGAASPFEIVAALVVTTAGAALLVPLAARIYRGAVLRTGSAVKLRDAWRAAGA